MDYNGGMNSAGGVASADVQYLASISAPEVNKPQRKKWPIVVAVVVAILALVAVILAVVITMVRRAETEEQARIEAQEIAVMGEHWEDTMEKVAIKRQDPIFRVTPYIDTEAEFAVEATVMDNGVRVKVFPLCLTGAGTEAERVQRGKDWLTEKMGDLSGYRVEVATCKELYDLMYGQ